MDADDGAGFWRNALLQLRGVQVQRERIDIHEYGRSSLVEDDVPRRDERERREDDLVTFSDPERPETEVQAGRSGTHGDGVRDAYEFRDRLFEFEHPRTDTQPGGSQHAPDGVNVGFGDVGGRKRNSHFLISSSSFSGT